LEFIDKAMLPFRKSLRLRVAAAGGRFEHALSLNREDNRHSSLKCLNCWRKRYAEGRDCIFTWKGEPAV